MFRPPPTTLPPTNSCVQQPQCTMPVGFLLSATNVMKTILITSINAYLKGEKPMVCLNGSIHLSQKQLTGKGFAHPILLRGATIEVEFFKKGDILLNEAECTKDDIIVKEFEILPAQRVLDLMVAGAVGATVSLK